MCMPWNHKWKTVDEWGTNIWSSDPNEREYPKAQERYIQQQCTHCGKEIVRRYHI